MPHSVSEFIRFYNSPFSYWCNKTNKLVDEKKIDAKYKIEINASKLISKQLLTKAQEHEVVLKDKYRISENLNVVDMSNKDSSNKVFLEELDKNPDVIFQPYISSKDFVGRLDFVKIVDDNLHIIDAKLSSSIKTEHIMQLFVYREILEAVTKKQVTRTSLQKRTSHRRRSGWRRTCMPSGWRPIHAQSGATTSCSVRPRRPRRMARATHPGRTPAPRGRLGRAHAPGDVPLRVPRAVATRRAALCFVCARAAVGARMSGASQWHGGRRREHPQRFLQAQYHTLQLNCWEMAGC